MTRQETINKAVSWALNTASNASNGYDQAYRWGPNYDCSSFVITAWQEAGVPVKTAGASYTGDMYFAFLECGFKDVTNKVNLNTGAGLKKGDVLLNKRNHTELYIGDGWTIKASINEKGTVTGGQSGDQTGREICIDYYYNYPWDCVLRYEPKESEAGDPDDGKAQQIDRPCVIQLPELQIGDGMSGREQYRPWVKAMQERLIDLGYDCGGYGADGEFGNGTFESLKKYQRDKGLADDGICGTQTYQSLNGG